MISTSPPHQLIWYLMNEKKNFTPLDVDSKKKTFFSERDPAASYVISILLF